MPEAAGHIYDAGGPEAVTYEQIMRCYGRLAGRQPRIVAVPVLTPRLSSYWLRFVTSVPTNVAQALVEGLEHDFIADDAPLRALVPRRLMGLEEAVRAAIEADRTPHRFRTLGRGRDRLPQLPSRVRLLCQARRRDRDRARLSGVGFRRWCAASVAMTAGSMPTPCGGCDGPSTGWRADRASGADAGTRPSCAWATSWIRGA